MASIQYDVIFNSFLGNITDYDFVKMSISDSYELMTEYLHKSVADPYIQHLFSSVSLDDKIQVLTFELKRSVNDEVDEDFISTALGKWMVYEWLHKQVRSVVNTAQFFGGKEQRMYSQAQHIAELRGLQDDAFSEARFFIQNRGYISNTYLDGGV